MLRNVACRCAGREGLPSHNDGPVLVVPRNDELPLQPLDVCKQPLSSVFQRSRLGLERLAVGNRQAMNDGIDGTRQLSLTFNVTFEDSDTQRLQRFDDVLSQDSQSLGGVCGDEDALALRDQMTDQIRDRVRLPGSGRSLDQDAATLLEQPRDAELLGIRWLAEEHVRVTGSVRVGTCRIALRALGAMGSVDSHDAEQELWEVRAALEVVQNTLDGCRKADRPWSEEDDRISPNLGIRVEP
jgi:hypothetical protein